MRWNTVTTNPLIKLKMNKSELISAMAAKAGITKVVAKTALEAFIETTGETLKKGDKIALVGFGTFSVLDKPARTGRNPRTGETLQISAKKAVKFKAGAELSEKI